MRVGWLRAYLYTNVTGFTKGVHFSTLKTHNCIGAIALKFWGRISHQIALWLTEHKLDYTL